MSQCPQLAMACNSGILQFLTITLFSEKMDASARPRPAPQNLAPPTPAPAPVPSPEPGKKDKKDKKKDKKDKKGKKKGISKADISGPSNFQHLSHLGWDKDKNQFDASLHAIYNIYRLSATCQLTWSS